MRRYEKRLLKDYKKNNPDWQEWRNKEKAYRERETTKDIYGTPRFNGSRAYYKEQGQYRNRFNDYLNREMRKRYDDATINDYIDRGDKKSVYFHDSDGFYMNSTNLKRRKR